MTLFATTNPSLPSLNLCTNSSPATSNFSLVTGANASKINNALVVSSFNCVLTH
ncbi:hypothetical protein KCU67_g13001, partial [Aureobasidium melanogenum]